MAFRLNCAFCGKPFNGTNDDYMKISVGVTSGRAIAKEGPACKKCRTTKTIPKLLKEKITP